MNVQDDIGPTAPPRWRVRAMAREVLALAQTAIACTAEGPAENLPRALAQLDRMRAVLGVGPGSAGEQ